MPRWTDVRPGLLFVGGGAGLGRGRLVLDVAGAAVARAARKRRASVGAVGRAVRLARLVHGAFDAEFLHVFIGRYFRVDVVPLDHQREGHAQYEQPDGEYGAKQED